jgi:hypothetical protein
MKRDWDLIRKQLTDIEEERDVLADLETKPERADQQWEKYEQQIKAFNAVEGRIAGCLEMLIENGYIDGLYVTRSRDGQFSYGQNNPRLTMTGHDLLATMRSTSVLESIKSAAKKKRVELTFETIKALETVVLK